ARGTGGCDGCRDARRRLRRRVPGVRRRGPRVSAVDECDRRVRAHGALPQPPRAGIDFVTDIEYGAPKRGSRTADRAVLLAHGAGADMHSANLVAFSDALAAAGIPTLRFNF